MPSGIYKRIWGRKKPTTEERFFFMVTKKSCWIWKGASNSKGYGKFWDGKKQTYAHRFSYELYKKPISQGLHIDHLCRNPSCVNPNHLEAVTTKENVRRGMNGELGHLRPKKRTHCLRGHEYTEENTNSYKTGRRCRKCDRIRYISWYKRKKKNGLA